jgi:hypothetical protein
MCASFGCVALQGACVQMNASNFDQVCVRNEIAMIELRRSISSDHLC